MNDKKLFWARFGIYVLFGLIAPVLFLIWRFELFQKISSVSVGGWGVVAIVIIFVFFVKMLKYIKKGLPYSFFTQCINGIVKVIVPLFVALLIIYCMRNCMEQLIQFLVVLIVCEFVAVPANPFPKWIHDNHLEQEENKYRKVFEDLGVVKPKENK